MQPLVGLSQSALSQHLATLREMERVTTRRESQGEAARCDEANNISRSQS
nr:ArsR family transcriptional regulator [Steroidobacter gossypii]